MKVIGLDGKEYSINLTKYTIKRQSCSKLHERARSLLEYMFPYYKICEEITLPGTKTERQTKPLIADFYIHQKRLMIEVQGEQHYKHNDFFFHDKMTFFKSKSRDNLKVQWCNNNNIYLVELPFNETNDEWSIRIYGKLGVVE